MGRFPQTQAQKGSQKWIQILINDKPQILNKHIWNAFNFSRNEDIQWLSPLRNDDYAEYRDQAFLKLLNVKLEKLPLRDFWPKGGPQWDALGRSTSGKLFLVEAKSHIRELISALHAKDKGSKRRILKSLKEVKEYLGAKTDFDWSKGFYQYTNRLAHLYLLRKNGLNAYLIFVYFINDSQVKGPKTISEWKGAIKLLYSCLGIERHRLKKYVAKVFLDINQL
ncbi:MAG: hypothetical protein QXX08_06415 [Candidatus Bathyarchaeia archaeon]